MRHLTLAAALLLAASGAAAQQTDDSFRWSGAIPADGRLELYGVNAGIRVTAGTGREAVVRATKRWRRGDPALAELTVVPHGDGVTICEMRTDRGGECVPGRGLTGQRKGDDRNMRHYDVSFEITVEMPAGAGLVVRSVNGSIRADGLRGDVDAQTVNGSVQVATSGAVRAKTVNGDVDVTSGRADWSGTQSYETVNGSVAVRLPATAAFELEASTVNGSIASDFPVTMQGRMSRKSLRGTVGRGGRELRLATVNGSVELRKE